MFFSHLDETDYSGKGLKQQIQAEVIGGFSQKSFDLRNLDQLGG